SLTSGPTLYDAANRRSLPSNRKIYPRSASHSLTTFSAIVSNTDCRSTADWLIALSTSEVAFCCSSDSFSLRSSSAIFSFGSAMGRRRLGAAFGALRRGDVLYRCLAALPAALPRRFIAAPESRRRHRTHLSKYIGRGYVRFGS